MPCPAISPRAAAALNDAVLVDVRDDVEWRAGHAPDATHIPAGLLFARSGELDRRRRIVVTCRSGGRSARATALLCAQGFDAIDLAGGMSAWSGAGLPVVTDVGVRGTIA